MRPDDVVRQPSAAIFNTTMIVTGALIVIAAVLLYRSRAGLVATLSVTGLGVGMIGVSIFPGNTVMAVHQLVSLATFLCESRGDPDRPLLGPGTAPRAGVLGGVVSWSATRSWRTYGLRPARGRCRALDRLSGGSLDGDLRRGVGGVTVRSRHGGVTGNGTPPDAGRQP